MAKVNITITATLAQLSTFADELGYLSQIAVGQEANGDTIMGANTQTKQEFLVERLKAITVNALSRVRTDAIDKEIRDQRTADKETIKSQIESAIAVTLA